MQSRQRPKSQSSRRRPKAAAFQAVLLPASPTDPVASKIMTWGQGIAVFLMLSTAVAALWSPRIKPQLAEADPFLFEEEIIPPAPPPPTPEPPPSDPEPPKVEPLPENPPPQFGLREEDLSEIGDLAVATGNTLQVAADSLVAPAPPPLPAAPVFVDQPPGILSGAAPEYPLRALDRGLEGTVIVLITIDSAGKVTQVTVEKSAGSDFDNTVLASARATLFKPPMRQGRKVAAKFRRPYEFKLE